MEIYTLFYGCVKHFSAIFQQSPFGMDYFKYQAKELMKIRKSGHLPDDKI